MTLSKREQDRLLSENFRQIERFATMFWRANKNLELDECIGEALLEVTRCVGRFDPNRGVKFTSWAWVVINRRLSNYRRDLGVRDGLGDADTDAVEAYLHDTETVEDLVDRGRLQEHLDERAPVLSRFLMGHTFTDLAAAEAVDKSTVSRRAAKETDALREILGQGATVAAGK